MCRGFLVLQAQTGTDVFFLRSAASFLQNLAQKPCRGLVLLCPAVESSMAAITVSENNNVDDNGACASMNTLISAVRVHPSAEELMHGSL